MKLALALLLLAGARPEAEVRFSVDKRGLKWTGPCSAAFFDADDERDVPAHLHDDVARPARVPRGRYHVQVRCPSTEGTLAKTELVVVKSERARVKARLRPGFGLVRVLRGGAEVPADLIFYDGYGRPVLEGRDKVAHPLPPGALQVVAAVRQGRDAAVTGRRQVRAASRVQIRPGRKTTLDLDLSDGQLQLTLLHNGEPAAGSGALYVPGTRREVARVVAGAPALAPPGVYDLAARLDESHDFSEVKERVVIRPGKTTRARLAHRTGTVRVELVQGGAPLAAGARATVELFEPGAKEAFNTLAKDERAVLAPGRYRVRATLEGKADAVGSVADEREVRVVAGRAKSVRLDLSSSQLRVRGTVGGQPERLILEVIRKGDVVVRRKARRDGTIEVPVSAGWYGVRAVLEAEQGHLDRRGEVRVDKGERTEVTLDLDLGRAVVQVFEQGVAVPAEVAYRREEAAEPLLRAPAGQEVFLPPGRYVLTVGRGRFERSYSPIAVAAGAVVERQLELLDEQGRTPAEARQAKERALRLKGE